MRSMEPLTCLTDSSALLVGDTSTLINLIATESAPAILHALPNRIVVTDAVPGELEIGRRRGRLDADHFNGLVTAGFVEIVQLGDVAAGYFEELVVGPAVATLDDGEAATIAYAAEHGAIAVLDERKATRICGERFPALLVGCTVDILAHPEVGRRLGATALANAVFNALQEGRMHVLQVHLEWVVELIGQERAARCQSLPRLVRQSCKR